VSKKQRSVAHGAEVGTLDAEHRPLLAPRQLGDLRGEQHVAEACRTDDVMKLTRSKTLAPTSTIADCCGLNRHAYCWISVRMRRLHKILHAPVRPRSTRPLAGPSSSQYPVYGLMLLPSSRIVANTCGDGPDMLRMAGSSRSSVRDVVREANIEHVTGQRVTAVSAEVGS